MLLIQHRRPEPPLNPLVKESRLHPLILTNKVLSPNMNNREDTQYHDEHTLNASTGDLSKEEVVTAFNAAIFQIYKKHNINTNFLVNLVKRFDEKLGTHVPKGISYVFFTNPEVYHMLIGRNPDGSNRFKMIPDPNWIKPLPKAPKTAQSVDPTEKWNIISSWADECEEIEEPTAPLIRVEDEPLTQGVMATDKFGKKFDITYQPSFVTVSADMDVKYDIYKLSAFVPENVTEKMLKDLFTPFSSVANYPEIKVTKIVSKGKRLVFIIFNHHTVDALFAKQLMFTYTFKGSVTVRFDTPSKRSSGQTHSR